MRRAFFCFILLVCNLSFSSESNVKELSDVELVANLFKEGPVSKNTVTRSDFWDYFDIYSEELMRRKSVDIIPLLIALINDNTAVSFPEGNFANICVYRSRVLVKYKVRYILRNMLDIIDYSAIIGGNINDLVDIDKALIYYVNNKDVIRDRMCGQNATRAK